MSQNVFLTKLLTLQQDGAAAISGPVNWNTSPLLEVKTELHSEVESLADAMLEPNAGTGRWHFFVGSPGNGKSAGAGMLVRRLQSAGHIVLESETKDPLEKLAPSRVPYCLEVRRPGEKFAYLYIAQDASVLPNPFDSNADPAAALIHLLSDAADRGVSLVVCTNRGVIERAYAQVGTNPSSKNEPWFPALSFAAGAGPSHPLEFSNSSRKLVFDAATVSVTTLDRRSLVFNTDTFDRLLETATASERWAPCDGCTVRSLCPFRSNRDWLADKGLRENVIRLIRHAELAEGQIIVLREALALISLILAGCPHDYDAASPCDWVRECSQKGDIFSLASRRIYMALFSAYSPVGFATDSKDWRAQRSDIELIPKVPGSTSDKTRIAVAFALNKKQWPSTDVGAQRLLGQLGVFAELDVIAGVPDADFSDRWSESFGAFDGEFAWFSGLERALIECWSDLQCGAASSTQQTPSIYRSLSRWVTAFTLRIGSLVEGVTSFGGELDALVEILQIQGQPTAAQESVLTRIEGILESSLTAENAGLNLTPTTTLHGRWARQALKPQFATTDSTSISASLMFGGASKNRVPLNTRAFIWLKRRAEQKMDVATFPREYLETARDAMLQIATSSSYDLKDEVALRIRAGDKFIEIKRSHRGTYVE